MTTHDKYMIGFCLALILLMVSFSEHGIVWFRPWFIGWAAYNLAMALMARWRQE